MSHPAKLTEWIAPHIGANGIHPLAIDFAVMAGFVMLLTLGGAFFFTRAMSVDRPGRGQQVLELMVGTLRNMITDIIPHHGEKYLGWIGCFTIFILFGNLLGEIPFFTAPTGYWIMTMVLGISSLLVFTALGLRETQHHYSLHFLGPVLETPIKMPFSLIFWKKGDNFKFPFLFMLFIILEPISHAARAFSLSLRLFANISGDHTVASTFEHIAPFIVPIPFILLGLLTAVIQTFIFTMLTIVFIGLAVEHH